MTATPTQTIDLVLGFVILMITFAAYYTFKIKKYSLHGHLMSIGFVMLIVSFLLVMLPSFATNYKTFLNPDTKVFDVASIIHIPFGMAGLGLGGFLVIKWARNDFKLNKMKAPFLMRITIISWISNVILGAIIFFTMPS
jgi:hypothetical protein